MRTLLNIELYKIFSKWRTYIGFIVIFVLVLLFEIAMAIEGENYFNFLTANLQKTFFVTGNFINGYLIGYIMLMTLTFDIPFLIALVAGDLLAGEATAGTYRVLITRPVSRFKIVTSKFIAGVIYTNLLILFLAFMSLVLGLLFFGTGELIVFKNKIFVLAENDILWRFIIAYGFASLSMCTVTALALLFSSLVENAIGPIIATVAVIIVFLIIGALDIGFLHEIKPYLFTTYMNKWRGLFVKPADLSEIISAGVILLGHMIVFFGAAIFIFRKKDILS